jgi:two-component system chemotaxis response regulator CheB
MPRIRVLMVDDSVVTRKVLCDALSADPEIEIAAAAADGNIALAKLPNLNPDLVTLDVEMPGKSGLETLIEIRKVYPKLPVIMFSSLTERGANTTLEALSLGASDYVAKPSSSGSLVAGKDSSGTDPEGQGAVCEASSGADAANAARIEETWKFANGAADNRS